MSEREVSLEDLLNNDARAYQFYFDQPPRVQTLLQMKEIHSFAEMAKAVDEIADKQRIDVV